MTEPVVKPITYLTVTAALAFLAGVNIALAFIDLRGWNFAISLLIAAIQIVLMGLFLMHLRWSSPVTKLAAVAALVWLTILLSGTMEDLLTRAWLG